ncbi:MAG: TfoX/Sxy family protein [Planctomycetota bacterium]
MPVSDDYLVFLVDQLTELGPVTHKRMFGGAGLYLEEHFFAIVADDVLYLKVNGTNRGDFEEAGMDPFRPYADRPVTMSYYEVPARVLDDRTELARWAGRSVECARRNPPKRKTRRRRSTDRPHG